MEYGTLAPPLSPEQFGRIRAVVQSACGITLETGRSGLVKSRLAGRLRQLALADFERYLALVEDDASGAELDCMIDALTTNKTSFFREAPHFRFLRGQLERWSGQRRQLRIWSAGCSSGEEPYSIAMVARDSLPDAGDQSVRILATDISRPMLARSRRATYSAEKVRELPASLVRRHFVPVADAGVPAYRVAPDARRLVSVARLNLIGHWPMQGPFDVIFCRNVMIYFDGATRQDIVRRFWELTAEGGFLVLGHTEGIAPEQSGFAYVQPSVYVKRAAAPAPASHPLLPVAVPNTSTTSVSAPDEGVAP